MTAKGASLTLAAILCCMDAALADSTVFSATDFGDALWDVTVVSTTGEGGTASGWHVETGGHTGGWRQCRITLSEGGPASVWAFHRCIPFTYDPATQGAISTIDFADYAIVVTGQHDTGPAIRQNGVVYAVTGLLVTEDTWTRQTLEGLTASDFHVIGGTSTPDFSANGSAFEVGFITGCATLVDDHEAYQVETGIDNWTFTVNPVPEPATLSLLALGSLALFRRRKGTGR